MAKRKKRAKTVRMTLALHQRDREQLDRLAQVHGTLVASVTQALEVYGAVVAAGGEVTIRRDGEPDRHLLFVI